MLPLRRKAMILGYDGPPVGELANVGFPGVDHGFYGKSHAGLDPETGSRPSVMEHLGLLMESCADTMPTKFSNDAESMVLGIALYRMSDVPQIGARSDDRDPVPHALISDLTQALCLDRRLSDVKHTTGIAMIAVFDHGDVDIHDVA